MRLDNQMNRLKKATLVILSLLVLCVLSSCGGGSSSTGGGTGQNEVGFTKLLSATFQHPRCQNCHGFETNNRFKQRHRDLGRLDQDCANCHFTPGWEAPFQSFSFTGISNGEICTAIKNKSGNDLQHLKEIILNSTLARWAIEDGGTLSGRLETAPPGSMAELARVLDIWIAGGASCD